MQAHSGDGSCCLRHFAPRQSPCSCLTGKLVEAHTRPRNTRPLKKHPTCQVGVNDPPPVRHSCLWCVGHVWVGNAGAASNGNDVWSWRQPWDTASQRLPNVARPAGKQSNSCRALQAISLYMQRSAHLFTSTWISGAPKCLLTSRGTNPTCLRAGRGGRATPPVPSQEVWSHHKQRQAGRCATQGKAATNHASPKQLSCQSASVAS